jgi:hypothetical protein
MTHPREESSESLRISAVMKRKLCNDCDDDVDDGIHTSELPFEDFPVTQKASLEQTVRTHYLVQQLLSCGFYQDVTTLIVQYVQRSFKLSEVTATIQMHRRQVKKMWIVDDDHFCVHQGTSLQLYSFSPGSPLLLSEEISEENSVVPCQEDGSTLLVQKSDFLYALWKVKDNEMCEINSYTLM